MNWKDYQKRAAEFFRLLGLTASVEQRVVGVRGTHIVDIYVEGNYFGIDFKWVIECKAWENHIPKEKVMALSSIVQDVGADRGFLLSENGFQAGALKAAARSNVTLTSLEELTRIVKAELTEKTLASLKWRLTKVRERLRVLKRQSDRWYSLVLAPLGKLAIADSALDDAVHGIYPNVYKVENGVRYSAKSFEELAGGVDRVISSIESIADQYEQWATADGAPH